MFKLPKFGQVFKQDSQTNLPLLFYIENFNLFLETSQKQDETIGDPIITKIDMDNEDQVKQTSVINFHYNQGIKKLQITKSYPIEKSGFKANKTRSKPLVLDLFHSIKQGQDNKLYDIMDVNQYMSLKDQYNRIQNNFLFNQQLQQQFQNKQKRFLNYPQQSQNVPKSLRCKCNKSMCLKQYCDCFANGNMCTNQCQCQGCHNSEEYMEEREEAISKLKIQNTSFEKEAPIGISCKCKKSKCTKKYCDCYQNKQKCNDNCQCNNCENQLEKPEYSQFQIILFKFITKYIKLQLLQSQVYIEQRINPHSLSQFDENSRYPKSPIISRGQFLFRRNDSMNYSNSFGYSRKILIQQEGPYYLKQDSQGFN